MLNSPNRRSAALMVAAGGGLAACGMVTKSPFFTTIATFNRSASPAISQAKIDAIPYASLVVWFDGSSHALLVLGKYEANERLVWYSAEHQALTTWGPFVLSLIGTDVGLYSSTLIGDWSVDLRSMTGRALKRTLNFQAASGRKIVSTTSSFKLKNIDEVDLIGAKRRLRHIRENVTANEWHTYDNDYWIDENTGVCLKSRQLVIPTMPKLNIIIAKKPTGINKNEKGGQSPP